MLGMVDSILSLVSSLIQFHLICSCVLLGALSAHEDRYTKSIPDFTVTIPRKVSEEGTFISHYLPHFYNVRRKKRDLSGEVVSYIIPLEGQDHLVHLWPNTDFLSPGLVVEHHSLAENNRSRIKVRKARDTQCHYSGVINGIDDSRVSMSTCYGLAGHIVTPQDEFFIEPSLDENRSGEYHKHYVYKREAIKRNANGTNCGTQGSLQDALKERMEWEIKYGKELQQSITSPLLEDIVYSPQLNLNPIEVSRNKRDCDKPSTCCPTQKNICLARPGHFVEVMITVDARLEKQFFFDLETYIFTIFNMVARNFYGTSIGETINLQLVRLLYLTYTLPRLDVSRFCPSKLLENFCDWQLEMNPILESHPNHHDIAVFITRFEPCQGSILGLTHMASVCRLDKSCVVASEEGLLLANIITHQIGHSIGADHDDGEVGGCVGEDLDGTIYHMNPKISTASTAWSVCSRHSIGTFIKSRMSWCLSDTARDHEFKNPDILAGQVYDAIQQCTLNYKMKTLACGTEDFCKVLYCQISPNKCATTGDPPAPGTPCAKGMWCYHGECVQQGQRPGTVDGNWSPWSPWSPCTRTCGGGVQSRVRSCSNPPPSRGGRYCFGERVTHRMCLTWPCPGYNPTFQDIQCKLTNKRPYRGHYFLWDHFQVFFEDMPCTLVCINELHEVTVRAPIVINGTPCKPGTKNVCIEGICREVGCDYVIDSNSKSDMCGICHGPGTGCKVVQGIFDEPDVDGMETILKLPEGTGMIFIRELDASACYAIISSGYNQTYYLNSPLGCDRLPGEFSVAGVSGVYDNANDLERIFIRDRIKAPIIFSIRCPQKGENQGWRYQYALPEEPSPCYMPSYKWEYLRWDPCSRQCGGGVQRARPSCVEQKGGEVEDKYCYDVDKPVDLIRPCNTKPCVAKWWAGPWSDCDCSDGEGIMTRLIFCMKPQEEDFALARIVRDKECCYQPKPKNQRPCSPEKNMKLFALERLERVKREVPFEDKPKENLASENAISESNELTNVDYTMSNEAEVTTEEISAAGVENLVGLTTVSLKKNIARRRVKKGHAHHLKPPKKQMTSAISPEKEGDGTLPLDKESISSIEERVPAFSNEKNSDNSELVSSEKIQKPIQMAESTTGNIVTAAVGDYTFNEDRRTTLPTEECKKTDFFLEQVFPQRKSTTCSVNETGFEPADLGPELEYGNNTVYKLFIVPIKSVPGIVPETDIGLSYFGKSVYFPPCRHKNKTYVNGDSIFRILQEARKRATTPPYIDVDDK